MVSPLAVTETSTGASERLRELKPPLSRVNGKSLEEFLKDIKARQTAIAPFTEADAEHDNHLIAYPLTNRRNWRLSPDSLGYSRVALS
jgi:hypothetical protein